MFDIVANAGVPPGVLLLIPVRRSDETVAEHAARCVIIRDLDLREVPMPNRQSDLSASGPVCRAGTGRHGQAGIGNSS